MVVNPGNGIVIRGMSIESQTKIRILGYKTPTTICCTWSPKNDIVTRKVTITKIEVHNHQVGKLRAVHPLFILGHGMPCLHIKSLETVVVLPVALFQVIPILYHVNILQLVVVGIDIILIRTFTNIENSLIHSILKYYSRTPGLPVQIYMLGHCALNNSIAHQEIVKIVTRITQHQRFEFRIARTLVGEELIG